VSQRLCDATGCGRSANRVARLLTVERYSMVVVMDKSIGAAKRRFERFIV
jgi:hypothetical protein